MTKDNYIKIQRIFRKSQLRIPIIICGETGCGKTHLVDFISSCLINDEFRCFTLNSGTTQKQILTRLKEYVKEAEKIQGKNNMKEPKKMWILIDEFNTSCHQSLIAEIMIERRSSFSSKLKSIPENIIFIGCCNPFRIDMSERSTDLEEEVGLVVDSNQNKLSHVVYPISDSLLPFIYDFG